MSIGAVQFPTDLRLYQEQGIQIKICKKSNKDDNEKIAQRAIGD